MGNTQTDNKNKKIAVGVSGGVDSSVTAMLLKQQGYDVTGVYMQCWDENAPGCTSKRDRADAVRICADLGIKFEHLDFQADYKAKVIDYFYSEYETGRTPNPDVMCNKEIKFGMFLNWALENGFDYVATGHYARVDFVDGKYRLLKGIDDTKDQSYFLHLMTQDQLSKTLFPVGGMKKDELRTLAKENNLITFDKPDSVGICFIGEVDIKDFLKQRIDEKKGNVVNLEGHVIGSHDGVWFYTIGQRHGFEITKYTGLPMYVIGKNVEKNELIVGPASKVLKKSFRVEKPHWIGNTPEFPLKCEVRVRHLGELYSASVEVGVGDVTKDEISDDANDSVTLTVITKDEIFGVAPGQSAVFYLGGVCLGGGVIVE